MKPQTILAAGAVFAFIAVGLGAFGAHGLKTVLSVAQLGTYQTAVEYQFYHALALLLVAGIGFQFPQASGLKWAAVLFVAGTVLFSGSLYALVFTGIKILGAVTPLGGLCFLAGWLVLAFAALKQLK
ncbi:MAG: DUF423 domain-containing protein [Pseudomonadales bacterium]|nr:DUF423 domain-containing protein [Pseudomonadales bacterium]